MFQAWVVWNKERVAVRATRALEYMVRLVL
jgi:hypothetical protein